MTFIAALRHDAITAPWVIDEPINGSIFRTYVEEVLVPTLRQGDMVILPFHRLRCKRLPGNGQPRKSQGPSHPKCHQDGWSKIDLPPGLFTRPKSNRAGLCQTQTPPAQGRRAQQRSRLAQDRITPRPVHTKGM
jgi:hypothetical protein